MRSVAEARESRSAGGFQDAQRAGIFPAIAGNGRRAASGGDGDAREFRAGGGIRGAARRDGRGGVCAVRQQSGEEPGDAIAGARLVEHGQDFEEARVEARRWAEAEGHHYVPSYHEWLLEGTATYSWELLRAVEGIDVAFVPIGMGSGILGMCAAREALGMKTEIVGVVSAHARAYYDSFARREVVISPARTLLADGWRFRLPMRAQWN